MKPFDECEMYVCGEAFSTEQGWVEGALKSTELVLHELGLRPFSEIPLSYIRGFGY